MKHLVAILFVTLISFTSYAQNEERQLLRGKVLYRNSSVPNENVINTTTENATITNENGEYAILVKVGDELVFSALNYQIEIVTITSEILKKNRLVIEVNEKVTQLDEVVVSPEEQEEFIKLQSEKFKGYEYEIDRTTEVENVAQSQIERGMKDGVNFVNIFNALLKAAKKNKTNEVEKPKLKVSQVLRQVYEDDFFVKDLKLPQDKIDAFLFYCDAQMPAQSLLQKKNEFQLIDYLVTHSKTFLENLDE